MTKWAKFRQLDGTWWNSNFYTFKLREYWQNAVNGLDANGNLLLQCQIYNKGELNFKLLFSDHVNSLLLPAILYSLMGQSSSLIGGIITGSQCWSHERDDQKAVQSVWGKNARRGAETQGWERNASGMHGQSVRAVLNLEVVSQSFHTLELTHVPSLLCLWLVMP